MLTLCFDVGYFCLIFKCTRLVFTYERALEDPIIIITIIIIIIRLSYTERHDIHKRLRVTQIVV